MPASVDVEFVLNRMKSVECRIYFGRVQPVRNVIEAA